MKYGIVLIYVMMMVMLLSVSSYAVITINTVTLTANTTDTAITTLYGNDALSCQANLTTNETWEVIGPARFYFYQNTTNTSYVRRVYGPITNNTMTNSSDNATVPASAVIKIDNWRCEVAAYNGSEWTNGTNSSVKTVNNTAPVVSGVALGGYTSSILSCSGTYSDTVDGDTQNASYYRWFDDGSVITGANTSSLNTVTYSVATGSSVKCEMTVEDRGYNYKNSTAVNTTALITGSNCYFGDISSQYYIVDMCVVLKVFTDLKVFIGDAYSPIITLMVLVIVLGAVLSIVGAILYTVFAAIQGSFKGWK